MTTKRRITKGEQGRVLRLAIAKKKQGYCSRAILRHFEPLRRYGLDFAVLANAIDQEALRRG